MNTLAICAEGFALFALGFLVTFALLTVGDLIGRALGIWS